MSKKPHTVKSLLDQLRRLGVQPGDTLMLHASLRRVGPVKGGAEGLLQALKASVGPGGTLLMVLGAELDWYLVNEGSSEALYPTETAAQLALRHRPFDSLSCPAMAEIGYLAEAFRLDSESVVNDHPDGRYACWGAGAHRLLDGAPWHHYYGPGSILERFCRAPGRILRMGADPDTVNALHYSEYLATLPHKRRRTLTFLVSGPDGPEFRSVTSLDNEHGIVEWSERDYFALVLEEYLDAGHGRRGQIGSATSELLEAQHLVEFGAAWMERRLCSASSALGS